VILPHFGQGQYFSIFSIATINPNPSISSQTNTLTFGILLVLYRLREDNYKQISRSEFLPDLDIALLERCVQISDILTARNEFMNGIRPKSL
jgi:hypothetical protein